MKRIYIIPRAGLCNRMRSMFVRKFGFVGIAVMMIIIGSSNNLYAQPVSGSINGHNYVDLGLPSGVLWATCNVGAYASQQYGSYFAWGETRSKSYYSFENNVTNEKSFQSIEGDTRYDAAAANWGSSWRLPTLEDANELVQRCTWIWTSIAGTNGYKVIGPNGKWIFLPAAGYTIEGNFKLIGKCGYYWTSTPETHNLTSAYVLGFTYYRGIHEVTTSGRRPGRSVRPVVANSSEKNTYTFRPLGSGGSYDESSQDKKPKEKNNNSSTSSNNIPDNMPVYSDDGTLMISKCVSCNGTGSNVCLLCHGKGSRISYSTDMIVTCGACFGLGKIECKPCSGTGKFITHVDNSGNTFIRSDYNNNQDNSSKGSLITGRRVCAGCNGTGQGIDEIHNRPNYTGDTSTKYCEKCGYVVTSTHYHISKKCSVCHGKGYVE